jgi:stage II sporulation protein D
MRAEKGAAKHAEASVCTNSTCCQGYLSVDAFLGKGGKATDVQRIRDLVASTDGQVLTYDGNLIEATYFSCSGGTTEDAVAVWGTDVPYLQSVASPGEEHATHYSDTVTFDASDFALKLGMALSGQPSTWFGNTTYTAGGGVATMTIGEKLFAGTELRKLLELRSTAFDVATQGDSIIITTRGYGHRVGMSQYGADAMAEAGSTYPEILAYYYQGTELTQYAD